MDRKVIGATPAQVWAVLADGWLYPLWMVGATTVRHVDPSWPAPGATIKHAVGAWPAALRDSTHALASEENRRLVLRVTRWPFGKAELTISLSEAADGTEVALEEKAVSGLGSVLPESLKAPALSYRNSETLTRLGFLAAGRSRATT